MIAQNEEAAKKENIIAVESISFPVDSVEWGTDDTMLNFESATISPSNATNPQIVYTSSDESVVSYHIWGAEVHKPGTAVITATSVSSGLTATLNVTVVEGQGKDGIYIEPTNPDEPAEKPEIDDEFTVNDITYRITSMYSNQVEVLKAKPNMNGVIIVPSKISYNNELFDVTRIADGKPAQGAARGAFCNGGSYGNYNTSVKEVILPNSITYIGDYAFCYCIKLQYIEIPEGVTGLGSSLFDFSGITTVFIPQSLKSLGGCGASTSTVINRGFPVKEVYYHGSEKEWDNLPDATGGYVGLKSVKVYYLSISKCEKDDEFTINDLTYRVIADDKVEIYDCDEDIAGIINIPEYISYSGYDYRVTNIGIGAFSDCTGFTSMTIPDSITSIEDNAFYNCDNIINIIIPDSVISIGDCVFEYCANLETITISDNIKSIGIESFRGCTKLASITIGNSVTKIENYAFYGCTSLESLTLSVNVTNIQKDAFIYCYNLKDIVFDNPFCEIYDSKDTISDTATIYGYENSTAQVYAEKYGRNFVSLGNAPENIQGDANGDGTTTIADIVIIQKALVKSDIDTELAMSVVDMNKDGKFNVFDLIIVKRMVLNS